jgi:vitamin-K-epoxide reductase (warfarin-sensitive)
MNIVVLILASVGLVVSIYAYLVEQKVKENSAYKPACDINNKISCTKAFKSKYSSVMGISNTIIGILFYSLILVTQFLGWSWLIYCLTIAGALASIVAAYILYAKVGSFCLVCTMIYIINFSLLIAAMRG